MANTRAPLMLAILVLLAASACERGAPGPFDRSLARRLPSKSQLAPVTGDLGLGVNPPILATVTPRTSLRSIEKSGVNQSMRESPYGGREYLFGSDPAAPTAVSLDLNLYEHGDLAEAQQQWRDEPPAVADRDWSPNLMYSSDAYIERHLLDWTIHVPSDRTFRWQGLCLEGGAAGCAVFGGWVQFCRWDMEIILGRSEGWDLKTPSVPQVMESIGRLVAGRVGCTT